MHKHGLIAILVLASACTTPVKSGGGAVPNNTNGGGGCGGPHPTGDVKAMAFFAPDSGFVVDAHGELWRSDASTGTQQLIAAGVDVLTQDGHSLYAWKQRSLAGGHVVGPLTIYDASGTAMRTVGADTLAGTVAYDVDDERIAFVGNVSADGTRGDVELESGGTTSVLFADQRSDAFVHATATGLVIESAPAGSAPGSGTITLYGNVAAKTLATGVSEVAAAEGAPRLVFAIAGGRLVAIDTSDGTVRDLAAATHLLAVAPGSGTVAYVAPDQPGAIALVAADGGTPRILAAATPAGDLFTFDGRSVLYRAADGNVKAEPVAGGAAVVLGAGADLQLRAAYEGFVVLVRNAAGAGHVALSGVDVRGSSPAQPLADDVAAGLYHIEHGLGTAVDGTALGGVSWSDATGRIYTHTLQ